MKSIITQTTILLLSFLFITSTDADSYQYQPHATIMAAAETHLQNSVTQLSGNAEIEILPLDHRLRLNRCEESLETFSPPGANSSGKTTVGVRCSNPNPWTLYVSANIAINRPVVVALKDLNRGTVISAENIELTMRDTSSLLRGHFNALSEVIGKTLKRSVRRDQVITPSGLIVEKTIQRGQGITILSGNGNIQVRMKGKALRNGNPGDLIPVQNLASKKKLEARVVSAGIVRID